MSDLETRVRDELAERAAAAGPWRVGGAHLRRTSAQRRSRRRRRGAAVSVAVAVAAAVAGSVGLVRDPPPDPDPVPVGLPTPPPSPHPSWTDVVLTPDMRARAAVAAVGSSDLTTLISTRLPRSRQIVAVLVGEDRVGGRTASTVTFASSAPGAEVRRGTTTHYPAGSSLIAQPAYDGDRAVLVVAVPAGMSGDTVVVTNSRPGRPLVDTSGPLEDRLALVPISGPEAVTRLRVLRQGLPVLDTVPAGWLLGRTVPRTISRVVVSEGARRPWQPVQVRTDGATACRVTAGGFWPQGQVSVPWNPFDAACGRVDGTFRLLLAADRRYSTVAGVAPPATTTVRLHWADGDTTEVTTAGGEVNAFVDPDRRRADLLVRAEALDADATVIARTETTSG